MNPLVEPVNASPLGIAVAIALAAMLAGAWRLVLGAWWECLRR